MRAKSPQLPEWDEIVIFQADFGPTTQPGPLFYRAGQRHAGSRSTRWPASAWERPVARDPAKPYVGIINAGNTQDHRRPRPAAGTYGPCGTAPRRAVDDPAPQTAPALCAPGLYNYFDSLAQATANLYGPYLGTDAMAHGGSAATMPAIKSTLVRLAMGVPAPVVPPATHGRWPRHQRVERHAQHPGLAPRRQHLHRQRQRHLVGHPAAGVPGGVCSARGRAGAALPADRPLRHGLSALGSRCRRSSRSCTPPPATSTSRPA